MRWVYRGWLTLRGYVEKLQSLTPEQNKQIRQYAKLIHILFPELRLWVESWELGAGFEEAHRLARRIVMEQWKTFASEQGEWVEALLTEDRETEKSEEKPIRQQTRAKLAEMFSDEDWKQIAEGAAQAIKQNILI